MAYKISVFADCVDIEITYRDGQYEEDEYETAIMNIRFSKDGTKAKCGTERQFRFGQYEEVPLFGWYGEQEEVLKLRGGYLMQLAMLSEKKGNFTPFFE